MDEENDKKNVKKKDSDSNVKQEFSRRKSMLQSAADKLQQIEKRLKQLKKKNL